MSISTRFNPKYGSGVTVTANAVSARSALGLGNKQVRICNKGAEALYVKSGDSTVAATAADFYVAPGTCEIITKFEDETNIAYLSTVTTTAVNIIVGEGF